MKNSVRNRADRDLHFLSERGGARWSIDQIGAGSTPSAHHTWDLSARKTAAQDKGKTDTDLTQTDLPLMMFFAEDNGSRFSKEWNFFLCNLQKR